MQECLLIHSYYTIQLDRTSVFMETLRIPLECRYKDSLDMVHWHNKWSSTIQRWVLNSFNKFNDFKKDLKLSLSSFGKIYVVSVLLRNAMACLYGYMTSELCDLRPPTLDTLETTLLPSWHYLWCMYQNLITSVNHGWYLYADRLKTISNTIVFFERENNI